MNNSSIVYAYEQSSYDLFNGTGEKIRGCIKSHCANLTSDTTRYLV